MPKPSTLTLLVSACLCASACASAVPVRAPDGSPMLTCDLFPAAPPESTLPNCAYVGQDGQLVLSADTKSALKEKVADEPVAVVISGKLYYLNAAGRAAPVLTFDNGADYFVEGLARTLRDSKVGFVDAALIERIAPRWDFAFPFNQGVAIVCQGCRTEVHGEHSEMVGGLWGYIDRAGVEVVPVQFARDELPAPPTQSSP